MSYQHYRHCFTVAGFCLFGNLTSWGGPPTTEVPVTEAPVNKTSGKPSILDMAPEVYYGLLRYPKFYGDPNMDASTIDGSLWERQYLLGSFWGARDSLANHGLLLDFGLTQVYQGAVSGDGDGGQYTGSFDLWAALDTGRANLWPGGLIVAHAEANWGDTVTGTGGLLPLNYDSTMPGSPSSFSLSEFYLFQALPGDLALVLGKVNWSAFADKSFFANNERTQFLHTGLNNNPILGSFVPYTSLGGGLFKTFNEEWSGGVVVTASNTNAISSGFDDLSSDFVTAGLAVDWLPKFGELPGSYNLLLGYNSKDVLSFDLDARHLIGEILGLIPPVSENGNWAITVGASQYLWVDSTAKRHDGLPVGAGPFARFGYAPKDRNVIDQFYSLGFGGYGGPFDRINDNWGFGWSGTHISSDLRRDAAVLRQDIDSFEHAFEAFYNFCVTPAAYLSLHAQYINSANPDRAEAFVLATKLQIDF